MRLVLLGTAALSPQPERMGPAVALEREGKIVVVDAGRGVTAQLVRAGFDPHDVTDVLITHFHIDHVCDLADLLYCAWHYAERDPVRVVGPPGIKDFVQRLLALHAMDIRTRVVEFAALGRPARVWDDVQVVEVGPGSVEGPHDWHVRAERVEHGDACYGIPGWTAWAYRLDADGRSVVISGDCRQSPGLESLLDGGVDVLVQSLNWAGLDSWGLDVAGDWDARFADALFADPQVLARLAQEKGVRHLVITHFGLGADLDGMAEVIAREYSGRLDFAEDLMAIPL